MQLFKLFFIVLALALTASVTYSAPFAYVSTQEPGSVADYYQPISVIDVATNTIVATVPLAPQSFAADLFVNPAGTRIYAYSYMGDNTQKYQVIDTASNTVVATIPLLGNELVFSPDGSRIYAHSASPAITELNAATNQVITSFGVGLGDVSGMAINPAGTRLYISNQNAASLSVIDLATKTLVSTIPVGDAPASVAVNLLGTRAYVALAGCVVGADGQCHYFVAVIDTITNTVIAHVDVGAWPFIPRRLAVSPDSTHVYVTATGYSKYISPGEYELVPGQLTVIDADSNTVSGTITNAGIWPFTPAASPTGAIYTADNASNIVSLIDPNCNTVKNFAVGSSTSSHIGMVIAPPATVPLARLGAGPAPVSNVAVTGIEVTQGIQDLANSVPLISGRRTFVRVYVKANGAPVEGVTATLSGLGNIACAPGLCPPVGASLGPLIPVNTVGPRITVSPNPKRSNLDDSFLFELPWQWTSYQSLRLHAVLNTGVEPPKVSCPNDILSEPLHEFRSATTLRIQFIRMGYTLPGTFNGITNQSVQTSLAEQSLSESFIRRTYPLSDLLFAPDMMMYDAGLGSRVGRTPPECRELPTAEKSLCAHNYITGKLARLQALYGQFLGALPPPGTPGSFLHEYADAAYALIPQIPNDAKSLYFTRGACCTARIGAGPSNQADYAAHEIGHFLGRMHPVLGAILCGHDGVDGNFPYELSAIADWLVADPATTFAGFDSGDASNSIPRMSIAPFIDPNRSKANAFDLMGYCKPDWISDYTYNGLYVCLRALHSDLQGSTPGCPSSNGNGAGAGGSETGDWLAVFGTINPTATRADFIADHVDRVASVPPRSPGNYSIRLLGAGGATIANYPFTPEAVTDTETDGGGASRSFGHVVPFVTGVQRIQIVDNSIGSRVIGEKTVSPNRPVIGSVALQGVPDPTTGLVTLGWIASDADADPLTFDIFFTRDGGESLQPLMLGVSGSSVQIDTNNLAGGPAQLRVVAIDGVQTAAAITPLFALDNKPPRPSIMGLGDGATMYAGQLINLEGKASDPQDGLIPETGLTWRISGRVRGYGSKLSVADLPLGVNQITLIATNSVGLSESAMVSVLVKESLAQPGPTLTAGPLQIGWHVGVGEADLQTAILDIGNSGSGNLEFTALSSAAWLTLSTTSGVAPTSITLTANPAGVGGGLTKEATVTLTAVGDPSQVIKVPVTLSIGNTFVVGKMSTAVGDVDLDGDVDNVDLKTITAALNKPASGTNDLRDLDGDGKITALDARKLVTLCTRSRCATQ